MIKPGRAVVPVTKAATARYIEQRVPRTTCKSPLCASEMEIDFYGFLMTHWSMLQFTTSVLIAIKLFEFMKSQLNFLGVKVADATGSFLRSRKTNVGVLY